MKTVKVRRCKKENILHPYYDGEFLKNEINADELIMRPKFTQGSEYINKWWKKKAIKRSERTKKKSPSP